MKGSFLYVQNGEEKRRRERERDRERETAREKIRKIDRSHEKTSQKGEEDYPYGSQTQAAAIGEERGDKRTE
jgi:hypothetical protein